jgi:hypothetical protein
MKSALHSLGEMAALQESHYLDNAARRAVLQLSRPSSIWKPVLSRDGNRWCALYGENIQEGVSGFGETPDAAMRQFDIHWLNETCGIKDQA